MSAGADARKAVEDAIAEMSTWCRPNYPGVAEFIARREERILRALDRLDEPDLDNDDPASTSADPDVDPDDEDDIDDEEFCPRCVAGVGSDEHHEKCVVTGHTYDGEAAPDPGPHGKCHEHADIIAEQRDAAMRHNGHPPADEDHTEDGRCLDAFRCTPGLGTLVQP